MTVYKGKVVGQHRQDPSRMCQVIVPQVTGSASQAAQVLATSRVPGIGESVWISYEGGDLSKPVVLSSALPSTDHSHVEFADFAPLASPTFTGDVTLPPTTSIGDVSGTELAYLDNVTSPIQPQLESKIPASVVDAKGDLLVGSAADTVARLAVGIDRTVLAADSSAPNGVGWAAIVNATASRFYLDYALTSDIGGYSVASDTPATTTEVTSSTACTGTSDVLVASFATLPTHPGVTELPAGSALRHIHAMTSSGVGVARLKVELYKRTTGGVETLLRGGYSPQFSGTAVTEVIWSFTDPSSYVFDASDRLVFKVYAARVSGPATVTVMLHYNGVTQQSFIDTTISDAAILESQILTQLNTKAPLESPTFTGNVTLADVGAGDGLTLGTSGPTHMVGTGSPEGVVAAPIGSTWIDQNVTVGVLRWVKFSGGTGNTGWKAEVGDTGVRDLAAVSLSNGWVVDSSQYRLRRVGDSVDMRIRCSKASATADTVLTIPSGFRPAMPYWNMLLETNNASYLGTSYIDASSGALIMNRASMAGTIAYYNITFHTADSWPTSLPGTAS